VAAKHQQHWRRNGQYVHASGGGRWQHGALRGDCNKRAGRCQRKLKQHFNCFGSADLLEYINNRLSNNY
jgi:hypothetical protein